MNNGEDLSATDLSAAEQAIGYSFVDRGLFLTCLTHKSWSNTFGGKDNERLEFLGDAVLELIVTETLFRASCSDEGYLTGLRQQYVSQPALDAACEKAGLMKFLRFSGGENNVGGKTGSNLFEAVLGGIYLDGGMEEAKKFVSRFLKILETENYKSLLQEYVQERTKSMPSYSLKERNGGYFCVVRALGNEASGEGASKKAAQTQAAKSLYEILTKRERH